MNDYLPYLIGIICSYLLGAIPFGYLMAKIAKGIDIRTVGSGNIGATNVARAVGWPVAILVLILDAAKGFVAAFVIPSFLLPQFFSSSIPQFLFALCGFLAIAGHIFPVYLRFKGGKGVATALGVFLALAPVPTLVAVGVWLFFVLLFKFVSLASIMASISLPISFIIIDKESLNEHISIMLLCILCATLVLIRHHANIKRIIKGTESKIGEKTQS